MTNMVAIEATALGGPGVLKAVEHPLPSPGRGEVLLRQKAVGVNYVDLNHRAGDPYPIKAPFVPGIEAVGEIIAVGDGVDPSHIGRRMAYAGAMPGAYATHSVIALADLFPVPDQISDEVAAAVTMQAMTASYLAHDAYRISGGDTVLVHAAAGGVGYYLVQFAKALGATVVGTARDKDKLVLIEAAGADHAVLVKRPEDMAQIRDLVGSVNVIYDGLGGPYVVPGLRLLVARGAYVGIGLAAGMPPDINPAHLMGHFGVGFATSLSIQWVNMGDFVPDPTTRLQVSQSVYDMLADGSLKPRDYKTMPLVAAADAHREFEAGEFPGKFVLTV